jgi:hypothetical protein
MPLVELLPPGQFISPLPIAPPIAGANNIVPLNRPPGDEPSLSTVKPSDALQFPNRPVLKLASQYLQGFETKKVQILFKRNN